VTPAPNPQSPIPVSRSSIRAWLLARQPAPPADLATKLAASVESAPAAVLAGGSVAAAMGALGTWLLGIAVERQETAHDASDAPPAGSRPESSAAAPDARRPAINTSDAPPAGSRPESSAAALDLLAADAFLTYAFEAASEEGGDVAGLASQLLARVRA
jgi:hypothetical protein